MSHAKTPAEMRKLLTQAGWKWSFQTNWWYAPNCITGQPLLAAYQSFLLGKRCEQPLVKQ